VPLKEKYSFVCVYVGMYMCILEEKKCIFVVEERNYWVVWKIRADFEGKLKRRRFKFLILFIKFKSFAARTFWTTQYIYG